MKVDLLLDYCYKSSERKFDTAKALLASCKYSDSLFFCHLALEFMLKGKFVEIKKNMFPITHDLQGIAQAIALPLNSERKKKLAVINTFNIAGRYDDYKLSFYKKVNKSFTKKYFAITKKLLVWIKNYSPEEK